MDGILHCLVVYQNVWGESALILCVCVVRFCCGWYTSLSRFVTFMWTFSSVRNFSSLRSFQNQTKFNRLLSY